MNERHIKVCLMGHNAECSRVDSNEHHELTSKTEADLHGKRRLTSLVREVGWESGGIEQEEKGKPHGYKQRMAGVWGGWGQRGEVEERTGGINSDRRRFDLRGVSTQYGVDRCVVGSGIWTLEGQITPSRPKEGKWIIFEKLKSSNDLGKMKDQQRAKSYQWKKVVTTIMVEIYCRIPSLGKISYSPV